MLPRLHSSKLSMASGAGGVCVRFGGSGGVRGYGIFIVVGGLLHLTIQLLRSGECDSALAGECPRGIHH